MSDYVNANFSLYTQITQSERRIAQRAVSRGAKLLDKMRPNWYKDIDLEFFDLAEGRYCICGQLAELSTAAHNMSGLSENVGYMAYIKVLMKRLGNANLASSDQRYVFSTAHGFEVPESIEGVGDIWGYMEGLWRGHIGRRRRADRLAAANA